MQLYDMSTDIGETRNLQSAHPEIVTRLTELLQKHLAEGRSTPGAKQPNDAGITLLKAGARKAGK